MILAWTLFLLLAGVIAVAGFWLSRFADVIAERTGLSGSWVGLVLMATVTSLPELVTGVTAVRVENAPDLAVGNIVGACMFNLMLLSLVDLFYRPACMFTRASEGHALSTGYGAVMLAMVGLNIAAPLPEPALPLSLASIAIVPVYLLALRTTFDFERRRLLEPAEPAVAKYPGVTLRRAAAGYAASALGVVAAGLLLPGAALELGRQMGWSESFVGTLFLAAVTALPELVVTLSAVRIGVLDMAIANLLGSNLFNIVVLAVDDAAYPHGPLLSNVSRVHETTILTALLMNGMVTAGLIYRPRGRPAGAMSWVSLALIAAYALNAVILHRTPAG
ncbi:sodium:calcium antiporter [Phenylobacterium sp.]|uniref:sodium:calcium antiporter n=1 Tax=Phenylobacterium sp. TaxID=1871053 RepID=UPI003937FCC3